MKELIASNQWCSLFLTAKVPDKSTDRKIFASDMEYTVRLEFKRLDQSHVAGEVNLRLRRTNRIVPYFAVTEVGPIICPDEIDGSRLLVQAGMYITLFGIHMALHGSMQD